MKRTLQKACFAMLGLLPLVAGSQTRYRDEIFTDDEIVVESNVTYATNIDFLTSNFQSPQTLTDIGTLSALADAGTAYPAAYLDPTDPSTAVKLKAIKMDVYYPSAAADDVTERPVMIYVHTGNFLPPPINGSPTGLKTDSAAVALCRTWARSGYVAVSIDYRLGWNPIATTVQERRGTLLNAVYRAIHDLKWAIRYLREGAQDENPYEIDESKIVVYGQGSGGYVAQAAATLDNAQVELYLDKFLPNPFDPTVSYIDSMQVGTIDGFGFANSLNLYRPSDVSAEFHIAINTGGALADESWLEEGDMPMMAINAVRDDFAPFDEGTVIVPTTQEEVVDVDGANVFIQKANDLGNNDAFASMPGGDPYTDRARSLYGTTWDVSNGETITINESPEGLFPIIRPLMPFLTNESAPWEWWDPNSPIAQTMVAPGVTAHMAALQSNPDMSPEKGQAYLDTINGYILPRIMCVFELPGTVCAAVVPENDLCSGAIDINENIGGAINVPGTAGPYSNVDATGDDVPVSDVAGCWSDDLDGSESGIAPQVDATVWFTFEGDGGDYLIVADDCGGEEVFGNSDSQMIVYSGDDCDNLVPVSCADDIDYEGGIYWGYGFFTAEENTTYYIVVDGFNYTGFGSKDPLTTGDFCLQIVHTDVAVHELDAASFTVYPNPANDQFTIQGPVKMDHIEVRNSIGALVYAQQNINSSMLRITSDLASGVYLVDVFTANGKYTQKLIVE